MLERTVQSTTVSLDVLVDMEEVGETNHQECIIVKGPEHEENAIAKSFKCGYITN